MSQGGRLVYKSMHEAEMAMKEIVRSDITLKTNGSTARTAAWRSKTTGQLKKEDEFLYVDPSRARIYVKNFFCCHHNRKTRDSSSAQRTTLTIDKKTSRT